MYEHGSLAVLGKLHRWDACSVNGQVTLNRWCSQGTEQETHDGQRETIHLGTIISFHLTHYSAAPLQAAWHSPPLSPSLHSPSFTLYPLSPSHPPLSFCLTLAPLSPASSSPNSPISLTLHSPPSLHHAPFPSPFLTQLSYSSPCGRGLLCHKCKSKVDQHFCPPLHHRPGRRAAECRPWPTLHAGLTGWGSSCPLGQIIVTVTFCISNNKIKQFKILGNYLTLKLTWSNHSCDRTTLVINGMEIRSLKFIKAIITNVKWLIIFLYPTHNYDNYGIWQVTYCSL